jgi:beta-lactamase class D
MKINGTYFAGMDGCAIVFDAKAQKVAAIYGEGRCRRRYTACSTFKWPLAVMAFDSGVLKDENASLKWDGIKRPFDSWNQDQTAASWMRNSVVWYSQRLTPQIGKDKMQAYLDAFNYGNRDISSGLTSAWLTVSRMDSDPGKGSLKISAFEQLEFMRKFWTGGLPVSPVAAATTKEIIFLEKSPGGYALHGKTGSGYSNDLKGDFGWFIGHAERNGHEYYIVTALTRDEKTADARIPGLLAKEIAKDILKDNAIW